jgi:hypothetical protein
MSINLRHVTSEKNVILACTTLGNKQRERGYRELQETMTMFRKQSFDIKCMEEDGTVTRNVWKRTVQ